MDKRTEESLKRLSGGLRRVCLREEAGIHGEGHGWGLKGDLLGLMSSGRPQRPST